MQAPSFNPLLCLADILEKVHQEKHFDTSISGIMNNQPVWRWK